jgi:hypothetical protein
LDQCTGGQGGIATPGESSGEVKVLHVRPSVPRFFNFSPHLSVLSENSITEGLVRWGAVPVLLILLLFSAIALILLVPAVKGMLTRPVVVPSDERREQPRTPSP